MKKVPELPSEIWHRIFTTDPSSYYQDEGRKELLMLRTICRTFRDVFDDMCWSIYSRGEYQLRMDKNVEEGSGNAQKLAVCVNFIARRGPAMRILHIFIKSLPLETLERIFEAIAMCKNLEGLTISGCKPLKAIKVHGLPASLTHLDFGDVYSHGEYLSANPKTETEFIIPSLSTLRNLAELSMNSVEADQMTQIAELTSLKILAIGRLQSSETLLRAKSLVNLTRLYINELPRIDDVCQDILMRLPRLKVVDLEGLKEMDDRFSLDIVSSHPSIQQFHLHAIACSWKGFMTAAGLSFISSLRSDSWHPILQDQMVSVHWSAVNVATIVLPPIKSLRIDWAELLESQHLRNLTLHAESIDCKDWEAFSDLTAKQKQEWAIEVIMCNCPQGMGDELKAQFWAAGFSIGITERCEHDSRALGCACCCNTSALYLWSEHDFDTEDESQIDFASENED